MDFVETMVSGEGLIPWHKKGNVEAGLMTAVEVVAKGGIDWAVEKHPMYIYIDGKKIHVPDRSAVVRMSDKKVIGDVGSRYELIQNAEAVDWMDFIIGAGQAVYTTAGSLHGGSVIWVAAKITTDNTNPDNAEKWFITRTSHNGSTANECYFTLIRPVCWNTLSAGISKRKNYMRIPHTKSAKEKMEMAKTAISEAGKYFEPMEKLFARMHDKKFTPTQLEELIKKTFSFKVVDEEAEVEEKLSGRTVKRQEKIMEDIFTLAKTGKGTELPGVKGTVWGAFNAVAEYTDHYMKMNKLNGDEGARRLDNNLWGRSMEIKQDAFDNILEMVKLAA